MEVSVKSIRNHLSLVIALVSILFSAQLYIVVERAVEAYSQNLKNNYSIIAMSKKELSSDDFNAINKLIASSSELETQDIIQRLSSDIKSLNIDLLKLSMPKFYKLNLSKYPDPSEIKDIKDALLKNPNITKVEDFSYNHDIIYKLLLLFKTVVTLFASVILVVTILLIFKELKIWQYQHNERMNIMGLFGAALWLRSAVLFRLAIVDALISSIIVIIIFAYLSTSYHVIEKLRSIDIDIVIFDMANDSILLGALALSISIFLAILIVVVHKEEV